MGGSKKGMFVPNFLLEQKIKEDQYYINKNAMDDAFAK
jgi:hypothetical protein